MKWFSKSFPVVLLALTLLFILGCGLLPESIREFIITSTPTVTATSTATLTPTATKTPTMTATPSVIPSGTPTKTPRVPIAIRPRPTHTAVIPEYVTLSFKTDCNFGLVVMLYGPKNYRVYMSSEKPNTIKVLSGDYSFIIGESLVFDPQRLTSDRKYLLHCSNGGNTITLQ